MITYPETIITIYRNRLQKTYNKYVKKVELYKQVLKMFKKLTPSDINIQHCEEKHFPLHKENNIINTDNRTNKRLDKSIGIIQQPLIVHLNGVINHNTNNYWTDVIGTFERRVNYINECHVKSLYAIISRNDAHEIYHCCTNSIYGFWRTLPNSIQLKNNKKTNKLIEIKIANCNFTMIDKNAHICNYYILTCPNDKWNLYGGYDANMYAFSENEFPHTCNTYMNENKYTYDDRIESAGEFMHSCKFGINAKYEKGSSPLTQKKTPELSTLQKKENEQRREKLKKKKLEKNQKKLEKN
jgi:hypothetical protein